MKNGKDPPPNQAKSAKAKERAKTQPKIKEALQKNEILNEE